MALLAKLGSVRNPAELVDLAAKLGDAVVLSDTLSMPEAVGMAWEMRGLGAAQITRIQIPVEQTVTPDGGFALRPTVPFAELLADL